MYNPAIQLKTGDFWVTFWPGSASGFTLHLCKAEGECIIAKLTHSEYASQFDFSEVQTVFQKRNPMKTLWQLYQNPFKSQFNGNPRTSLQIFWVIQGGEDVKMMDVASRAGLQPGFPAEALPILHKILWIIVSSIKNLHEGI